MSKDELIPRPTGQSVLYHEFDYRKHLTFAAEPDSLDMFGKHGELV